MGKIKIKGLTKVLPRLNLFVPLPLPAAMMPTACANNNKNQLIDSHV